MKQEYYTKKVQVEYDDIRQSSTSTLPINRDLFITGYSLNSKGVWMFEIEVTGSEGLLSTYIIRRRYNDFKTLHAAIKPLHAHLPEMPLPTVWTSLRGPTVRVLEHRRFHFQRIVESIQNTLIARTSNAFSTFLGETPFSNTCRNYISLHRYASSTQLSSEIEERRKRKRLTSRESTASISSLNLNDHESSSTDNTRRSISVRTA